MRRERANLALSIVALLSLFPAVLLLCGYFASIGPNIVIDRSKPIPDRTFCTFVVEGGRFLLLYQVRPQAARQHRTANAPTIFIFWTIKPTLPDFRRCIWEFDAHLLPPPKTGQWTFFFVFGFPIWCALLPCLIAPVLWIRQRRLPILSGFDVIPRPGKPQAGV